MKSYCFNCIFFFKLLYIQVSGQNLMFISALPGETIVLKYNFNANFASWFVPSHDETNSRSVQMTDIYGQVRRWNIRKYSHNSETSNLTHKNQLQIVGNNLNGEFFLKIINITTDDVGLYRCEIIIVNMGDFNQVTNSFIVTLKYIANLSITYEPPKPIYEGYSLHLCCLSNNDFPNETVRWFSEKPGLQKRQKNSKKQCLHFENVNRNDNADYMCKADHDGQTVTKNISLNGLYPPSIKILNHTFTPADTQRIIQCEAYGDPMKYTYGKWEHKSFFNEHIRYLDETQLAILILPFQEKGVRYQDSGIYVCTVSNGVPDIHGTYFQKEQSCVLSKGPPVYVNNNKRIQYGIIGKEIDIVVNVHSFLNITNHSILTTFGKIMPVKAEIYRETVRDIFYGQLIMLFGWKVIFKFPELTIDLFQKYTITISNELGNANYVAELKSKVAIFLITKATRPVEMRIKGNRIDSYLTVEKSVSFKDIVIILLVVITALLVTGIGLYVQCLKQRYKKRMITAINVHTPEGNVEDIAHYTEIDEDDNIHTTWPENDNLLTSMIDTIVVDNRDISLVSAQRTSASSNNVRNSSEYLDDGYEQPYTIMVVNNRAEDNHVYLSTKKNSNYENSNPFQNAACGYSYEFSEQDFSADQTNAHDDHANVNLKYDMNDVKETDIAVDRQSNIYPQMNKAVYINLSLDQ